MSFRKLFATAGFWFALTGGSNVVHAQGLVPTWNMSMFSRANCINNESISWEVLGNYYWNLFTESYQTNVDTLQVLYVSDGPSNTFRSAAISWFGAGTSFWQVEGTHWIEPDSRTDKDEGWYLMGLNCPDGIAGATGTLEQCVYSYADNCEF